MVKNIIQDGEFSIYSLKKKILLSLRDCLIIKFQSIFSYKYRSVKDFFVNAFKILPEIKERIPFILYYSFFQAFIIREKYLNFKAIAKSFTISH